jgi:hypothetical protein
VKGSTPFLAANRRTELPTCLRPRYNTSHIHESLLISKQLGSYGGIKVPDQPSTLVHVHEYQRILRRHGGLLGMSPQDEGFCIGLFSISAR